MYTIWSDINQLIETMLLFSAGLLQNG